MVRGSLWVGPWGGRRSAACDAAKPSRLRALGGRGASWNLCPHRRWNKERAPHGAPPVPSCHGPSQNAVKENIWAVLGGAVMWVCPQPAASVGSLWMRLNVSDTSTHAAQATRGTALTQPLTRNRRDCWARCPVPTEAQVPHVFPTSHTLIWPCVSRPPSPDPVCAGDGKGPRWERCLRRRALSRTELSRMPLSTSRGRCPRALAERLSRAPA